MKRLIELNINGEAYELAVEPNATLAQVIRDQVGLTGTKEACGTGECGTCIESVALMEKCPCATTGINMCFKNGYIQPCTSQDCGGSQSAYSRSNDYQFVCHFIPFRL